MGSSVVWHVAFPIGAWIRGWGANLGQAVLEGGPGSAVVGFSVAFVEEGGVGDGALDGTVGEGVIDDGAVVHGLRWPSILQRCAQV